MAQNIFSKLENDIMKILSRNSDKFLSQYKIYEELLEDLHIKDPYEKNQLKIRLIIVLHLCTFKTPILEDKKICNNVKSIVGISPTMV
jgi:uncharacterized CHY-type Zn-finger protein